MISGDHSRGNDAYVNIKVLRLLKHALYFMEWLHQHYTRPAIPYNEEIPCRYSVNGSESSVHHFRGEIQDHIYTTNILDSYVDDTGKYMLFQPIQRAPFFYFRVLDSSSPSPLERRGVPRSRSCKSVTERPMYTSGQYQGQSSLQPR